MWSFAEARKCLLADIGEPCDHVGRMCRARTAICGWIDSSSAAKNHRPMERRCLCPPGQVPVYQTYLHYHECFPKVDSSKQESSMTDRHALVSRSFVGHSSPSRVECTACLALGGVCYDENQDGLGDGCLCPTNRSQLIGFEKQLTAEPCKRENVFTQCSKQSVVVCYRPYSTGPYASLVPRLKQRSCILQVGSNETGQESCQLKWSSSRGLASFITNSSSEQDAIFCVRLMQTPFAQSPCGTQFKSDDACTSKNGWQSVSYSGIIGIQRDQSNCEFANRLSVPFTCQTKLPCDDKSSDPVRIELPMLHRIPPQLVVVDNRNRSVSYANEKDAVRLELRAPVESLAILVDYCFATAITEQTVVQNPKELETEINRLIHNERCGTTVAEQSTHGLKIVMLQETLWPLVAQTAPVQSSNAFRAIRVHSDEPGVRYWCQLRVCTHSALECMLQSYAAKFCSNNIPGMPNISDTILVYTDLTVLRSDAKQAYCPAFSCFTLGQLLLACGALILLDIIICGLLIWSCRRRGTNFATVANGSISIRRMPSITDPMTNLWPAKHGQCSVSVQNAQSAIRPCHLSPLTQSSSGEVDRWMHTHLIDGSQTPGSTYLAHRISDQLQSPTPSGTVHLLYDPGDAKNGLIDMTNSYIDPEII